MRIKNETRAETIIKKSRFIACAAPIDNQDDARVFIANIRKEFSDATHVCTAYRLGENPAIEHSNDNGEPSGTAGMPILEAIRSNNLTDTCVCVVRYFGGIKLGTGGLGRAYNGSAISVLKAAQKVEYVPCDIYSLTYPYALSGTIENYIRHYGTLLNTTYGQEVTILFTLPVKDPITEIQNLTHGACVPVFVETTLQTMDVTS